MNIFLRQPYMLSLRVLGSFYLHNGISYTGKISSLYWIRDQVTGISTRDQFAIDDTKKSGEWGPPLSSSNLPTSHISGPWRRRPNYWLAAHWLTYGGGDKMADILQTAISNVFCKRNLSMLIDISWKFVPEGPIGNMLALDNILANGHCPLGNAWYKASNRHPIADQWGWAMGHLSWVLGLIYAIDLPSTINLLRPNDTHDTTHWPLGDLEAIL